MTDVYDYHPRPWRYDDVHELAVVIYDANGKRVGVLDRTRFALSGKIGQAIIDAINQLGELHASEM